MWYHAGANFRGKPHSKCRIKMTAPTPAVKQNNQKSLFTPHATLAGGRVSPTLGMNVTAKKLRAEGKLKAHFGFGQAPFPVPPVIQEALRRDAGRNAYLPSDNTPEIQEAVRKYVCGKAGLTAAD